MATRRVEWSVIACENVVAEGELCGQWMIVRRGDLPTCRRCKHAERTWRLVLPAEIEDFDRRLMRELGIAMTPDGHLGAVEQS
jgi:hypothetical protein